MSRHFAIYYNDLNYEKQSEIEEAIYKDVKEEFEEEARDNIAKYPQKYKGKTHEEVLRDLYGFDIEDGYEDLINEKVQDKINRLWFCQAEI